LATAAISAENFFKSLLGLAVRLGVHARHRFGQAAAANATEVGRHGGIGATGGDERDDVVAIGDRLTAGPAFAIKGDDRDAVEVLGRGRGDGDSRDRDGDDARSEAGHGASPTSR
jgi:hypothetical protein